MRLQGNRVGASLPVTWSLSCPLFLHHYIQVVTWALKHQRHFVASNFAQNCPRPIFQPQPSQEFNFNPIFTLQSQANPRQWVLPYPKASKKQWAKHALLGLVCFRKKFTPVQILYSIICVLDWILWAHQIEERSKERVSLLVPTKELLREGRIHWIHFWHLP